ncbi:MAG: hypothetical protein AAGA40_14280, partial [Cyanobacteria bacterium P01_E01_bin.45]
MSTSRPALDPLGIPNNSKNVARFNSNAFHKVQSGSQCSQRQRHLSSSCVAAFGSVDAPRNRQHGFGQAASPRVEPSPKTLTRYL